MGAEKAKKVRLVLFSVLLLSLLLIVFAAKNRQEGGGSSQWLVSASDDAASVSADVPAGFKKVTKTIDAKSLGFAGADVFEQKPLSRTLPMFNPDGLRQVLQKVQVDNNGNIVLDHKVLLKLDRLIQFGGLNLDEDKLERLQLLIRSGLPDPAAEQAASLVADYFHLTQVQKSAIYTSEKDTLAEQKSHYLSLKQLRRSYLGVEVADALFAKSDAAAEHMFNRYQSGQQSE